MSAFLALAFYFEIVKKDLLKSYWSTNSVLIIPFLRTVTSRVGFYNILSFLHSCSNSKYISKCKYGYNPKKKLSETLSTMKEKFSTLWTFWQHISIDEGTVQFKENIHFRVHNPIKQVWKIIFKLFDSTNGCCCSFDINVGETGNKTSKYGKTYGFVMSLLENYEKPGETVYMDNFYTFPYFFTT